MYAKVVFFSIFLSLSAFGSNITRLRGDVTLNGAKASVGMKATEGDLLEVGKASFVDISFEGGDLVRLTKGKTRITKLGVKKETVLGLLKGGAAYIYAKKGGDRNFKVNAPYTSFAVRGTKFMIEAQKDNDYLCVCDGKVEAQQKGKEKTVQVGRGEDLHSYEGKPLGAPIKSPMMFSMTADVFKEMGLPVAPLK